MRSNSLVHRRTQVARRFLIGMAGALLAPLAVVSTDAVGAAADDSVAQRADVMRLTLSTSQARFDRGVDNQGWWSTRQRNNDDNDNYVVGECPPDECAGYLTYRNFFTFRIPQIEGRIVAAKLVVRRYRGGDSFIETLGLYDVRTPAQLLNDNRGLNPAIYRDLGTGTGYGVVRVRTQDVAGWTTVGSWLNRAALADIKAASGHYFSVGGALLSARRADGHFDQLFGFSHGTGVQELRVFVERPG